MRTLFVSPSGRDDHDGSQLSPLRTLQAAVSRAAPATDIRILGGTAARPVTYAENIVLPSKGGGAPNAPIRIGPHAAPGSVKVMAAPGKPAIKGLGVHDWHIRGLQIEGGTNGLHFAASGVVTNICARLVFQGLNIHNQSEDGVKVSQADDVHTLDCLIRDSGQQNIDYLAVVGGSIQRNDVAVAGVAGAICVKGGSAYILIAENIVSDVREANGIVVGGRTGEKFFRPDRKTAEAIGMKVYGNKVIRIGGYALALAGAHDTVVEGNYLEGGLGPERHVIAVTGGSSLTAGQQTNRNSVVHDNVLAGAKSDVGVNSKVGPGGVVLMDNERNTVWDRRVGPQAYVMWPKV